MFKGLEFKKTLFNLSFKVLEVETDGRVTLELDESNHRVVMVIEKEKRTAINEKGIKERLVQLNSEYNVRAIYLNSSEFGDQIVLFILNQVRKTGISVELLAINLLLVESALTEDGFIQMIDVFRKYPHRVRYKIEYFCSGNIFPSKVSVIRRLLQFGKERIQKYSTREDDFVLKVKETKSRKFSLRVNSRFNVLYCYPLGKENILYFGDLCSYSQQEHRFFVNHWRLCTLFDRYTPTLYGMNIHWSEAYKQRLIPREFKRVRINLTCLPFIHKSNKETEIKALYAQNFLTRKIIGTMGIRMDFPLGYLRFYLPLAYKYNHDVIKSYIADRDIYFKRARHWHPLLRYFQENC